MKTIAIITARGGSKRIPRKNIRDFCGKPIIAYSIEAALGSKIFDTVMVSTDDQEIASIAIKYGADVPFFRSRKNADDFASTNDVLLEVIQEYESKGEKFDIFCCLYPTAPFVTASKLQNAYERFLNSDADSLIPVVDFSYPPQRAMQIIDGLLKPVYPENIDTRSQDLEKQYHDAGQFYFAKTERFKQLKKLMVGKVLPMPVPEIEVQDIDNLSDWELAQVKYTLMTSRRK